MENSTLAKLKKIRDFLDEKELVHSDQATISRWRMFAHFWLLVGKSFVRNRGPVRASSLAYTTLLALIPILAVVMSISTSLILKDGNKPVERMIDYVIDTAAPQLNLAQTGDAKEAAQNRRVLVEKIMGYVDNVNSGKLGVTAGVALIAVVVSLLSTIEGTFNDIWGVTQGRTWFARIVQYWATVSLGPIFLATASGLTTASQFTKPKEWLEQAPFIGGLVFKLVPFLVLSLAFALFYKLMPFAKVWWKSAFVGGVVGGCLLQLNNIFSVIYVSKVVGYSKIYGSLGVLPIFLVGLYFSWLILLFGAQVSYAYQNRIAYFQERQSESINQRGREFAAMRLMTHIAQQFLQGAKPASRPELSAALGIPSQLGSQILASLVGGKLLIEVAGEDVSYVPGRPLDKITVEDVLHALRVGQGHELATRDEPVRAVVREEYERVLAAEMQTAGAVTFQTLAMRAQSLPPIDPARSTDKQAAQKGGHA